MKAQSTAAATMDSRPDGVRLLSPNLTRRRESYSKIRSPSPVLATKRLFPLQVLCARKGVLTLRPVSDGRWRRDAEALVVSVGARAPSLDIRANHVVSPCRTSHREVWARLYAPRRRSVSAPAVTRLMTSRGKLKNSPLSLTCWGSEDGDKRTIAPRLAPIRDRTGDRDRDRKLTG